MSKHMTIINLACTITKLRKWGEAWKHSAESAQAATARMHQAHEAKMVEHRAAFGARTEADARIIAGLRADLEGVRNSLGIQAAKEANKVLGMIVGEGLRGAAERVARERDGLLTQVQDMRAEIERLRIEAAKCKAARDDLYQREGIEQKRRMDVEDERDALRAEVDFLKTLRPKYKVGDKLESYSSAVTIVGVRTVYDCQTDGAEYPVGHSEDELTERYEQTADHDTVHGKAAAESAVRTEPVADEIKVWDVVEVYQATGKHTAQNDVGFIGTVGTIHLADRVAHVRSGLGMPHMVDLCDVRKVRKVTT